MPQPRRLVTWETSLPGRPADEALEPKHEHEHEMHDMGGSDMHSMMEIRGDPSRDGLVMEPLDFELGPLAAALPGGLVLELSLDGDVVRSCRPRALLSIPSEALGGGAPPDPLAGAAWAAALALGRGEPVDPVRVAAIEHERALSHASWLRGLGMLLGWAELAQRAQDAVTALASLDETPLAAARVPVDRLLALLDGSRRLRWRTRGRAVVDAARLAQTGVGGPVARAAGLERDARAGDGFYASLGFRPELHDAGDAEARTLVRAREAAASLRLAIAAFAATGAATAVEGPRGRISVELPGTHVQPSAPGADELLGLAGEAVRELELAAALVGIASFDLSPWQVPA